LLLRLSATAARDEILQGRLINLVAFVDVKGAPDIPVEAGVALTFSSINTEADSSGMGLFIYSSNSRTYYCG
jgi:hypothetical protein